MQGPPVRGLPRGADLCSLFILVLRAQIGYGRDPAGSLASGRGAGIGSGLRLPVRRTHASLSKVRRAEPIAAFFESGDARLAGRFPALEDQLAHLVVGSAWQGPTHSPDRADAMIWAMTELLLGTPTAEPRIRQL